MAAAVGFPFTWAQWKELERQAMIYKYMAASIPVPPDLLLPITPSLSTNPSAYSHSSLGNGSGFNLHMELSSSNSKEAEPGRCKRTDGKKWRCSRDVAPCQKYCERHLNRGRPRSRKPVEVLAHSPSPSPSPFNKKTRLHHQTLPNPTAHSTISSHGVLGSTIQPNGFPLFLDKTGGNLSVSSFKEPSSRGFDWNLEGQLNLNPYTDFGAPVFLQDCLEEPLNLIPYNDFCAPDVDQQSNECTVFQMESPRGFIDAWLNEDSNNATNKKTESSVSSRGNLWPSSLTLSMAMAAGDALDEEMGSIETGLGIGDSHHKPHVSTNWHSSVSSAGSEPGGPLAEMLRPACSDSASNPATRVSSPTGVLQRALLSVSDSSGCTSPAISAPMAAPEIMPSHWLNN